MADRFYSKCDSCMFKCCTDCTFNNDFGCAGCPCEECIDFDQYLTKGDVAENCG